MKRTERFAWERVERLWAIYALIDPRNGAARYIGLTCREDLRPGQHARANYPRAKAHWIRVLADEGYSPLFKVLCRVRGTYAQARQCERAVIEGAKEMGHVLFNKARIREQEGA